MALPGAGAGRAHSLKEPQRTTRRGTEIPCLDIPGTSASKAEATPKLRGHQTSQRGLRIQEDDGKINTLKYWEKRREGQGAGENK